MEEVEKSAASVEEAIEAALGELGLTEQQARIEIVQEPARGLLGLSHTPAVVRVRPLTPTSAPPRPRDDPAEGADASTRPEEDGSEEEDPPDLEELEDQADLAADFVEGLLEVLDLEADVETGLVGGIMYVDLWAPEGSEGMAVLIGRHGHTLDAVQELVKAAVHHQSGERCRVVVDVEDYRKRRRDQVAHKAGDVARRVLKTGRPESLEPMGAFERKIVHDTVADYGDLETGSEGQEPNRFVVVRRRT